MSDQGPVDKYTMSDQGLAWEQALCLGEKIARKGKGKGGIRFSLSLDPRSTKGLFTG